MRDIALFVLPGAENGAQRLAQELRIPLTPLEIHRFPDGELKVTAQPVATHAIVYAPLDHPNDKLLALLFASEALRRQGAQRLILVAPYMCYMRQDAPFEPGEGVSQMVVGKLLADAFDRILTVDAHLHRVKNIADVFPGVEAEDLTAVSSIADALAPLKGNANSIIAGPDEESEPWVKDLAGRLGVAHVVARKNRHSDHSVDITFFDTARIAEKNVILLDDMISSGGTILACAKALKSAGASQIDVVVTHALFDEAVGAAFATAGIRSIRSTDSVPHTTNCYFLAATLAHALQRERELSGRKT